MIEILNDTNGKPSLSKLLLLGSFFVSSWVIVVQAYKEAGVGEGLLGVYLAAYAGAYVGGKFADRGAKNVGTSEDTMETSYNSTTEFNDRGTVVTDLRVEKRNPGKRPGPGGKGRKGN